MKVLTFLLHHIHYFALSLLALTMVFWPIVETRFGSNKMTVLGIAVSILLAFIIHFHVMLNKLLKSGQDILNAGIGDAFREILSIKNWHVNHLRIYAFTTEVILPIVRDVHCSIDTCHIALHKFDENGRIRNAKKLQERVKNNVEKWFELKNKGKIRSLDIVYYEDIPYEYLVIFDDDALITGLYNDNNASLHGISYNEPFIIFNNGTQSGRSIDKHCKWFDVFFMYWKNRIESH